MCVCVCKRLLHYFLLIIFNFTNYHSHTFLGSFSLAQAFDRAVMDRVDEIVEVSLPGTEERTHLLKMYFKQYVVSFTVCVSCSVLVYLHGRGLISLSIFLCSLYSHSLTKIVVL